MSRPKISNRQIARVADCDPETVAKLRNGGPVRPRVAARIRRALATLGIELPAPKEQP